MHAYPPLAPVTIGVMGSGTEAHADLAAPLGALLARLGVNLLTGGGCGVMAAVSRAFSCAPRERGICIGVLPCAGPDERGRPKARYPNAHVELAIHTHLPLSGARGREEGSRNHINVLTADAIVVLPGGAGTRSEVELALEYERPLIAYLHDVDEASSWPQAVTRATDLDAVERFLGPVITAPRVLP